MHITTRNLTIRKATKQDANTLLKWWNDGNIMSHAGFPKGLGLTLQEVENQIDSHGGLHLIVVDKQPIGEIHYSDLGKGTVTIGLKICQSTYQRQGWGKCTLIHFIQHLFQEGYQTIVLETNLTNLPAQALYESLGFQKTRIDRNSWTDQLGHLQSRVHYQLTASDFIPKEARTLS